MRSRVQNLLTQLLRIAGLIISAFKLNYGLGRGYEQAGMALIISLMAGPDCRYPRNGTYYYCGQQTGSLHHLAGRSIDG